MNSKLFQNVNLNLRCSAGGEILNDVFLFFGYDFLQEAPDFGFLITGNARDETASILANFDPLLRLATLKVILSTPSENSSSSTNFISRARKSSKKLSSRGHNIFFLEHQATVHDLFKRTSLGWRIEIGHQFNRFARAISNHFNKKAIKYIWRMPFGLGYGLYQRHEQHGMGSPNVGISGLYLEVSHCSNHFKPTIGLSKELGSMTTLSARYDMAEDEYAVSCAICDLSVTGKSKGSGSGIRKNSIQVHVHSYELF
mmetsp:Transcript_35040/g.63036  ORF Transcript_35040/g.63036 Transcript_35040/m.63036 type:complete len:256 (-) Transcript_35040:304-1071(-)